MADWLGETSEASSVEDRFVRKYVTRLITQGDCKPEVAYAVVHDLLLDLGRLLNQMAEQAQDKTDQ